MVSCFFFFFDNSHVNIISYSDTSPRLSGPSNFKRDIIIILLWIRVRHLTGTVVMSCSTVVVRDWITEWRMTEWQVKVDTSAAEPDLGIGEAVSEPRSFKPSRRDAEKTFCSDCSSWVRCGGVVGGLWISERRCILIFRAFATCLPLSLQLCIIY